MRLSADKRDKFLEALGQTGNRRYAAEAIGVEARLMDQRRRFDKELDRGWTAALEQADRRLSGADGPFDCIGGRELNVITRGKNGRLKLVASGSKRWNGKVEARFLAALSVCGNVAAAARSVGYGESCVWQRRRQWPAFAAAMERVLEEAEVRIEFRLAALGNDLDAAALEEGDERPAPGPAGSEGAAAIPFDPEFALRFLKWREEKRRGTAPKAGRQWRGPRTLDEVTGSILRKISAIKRHRRPQLLAEGWSEDENGRLIPPGWVRARPEESVADGPGDPAPSGNGPGEDPS
jgi:hypothetical protein